LLFATKQHHSNATKTDREDQRVSKQLNKRLIILIKSLTKTQKFIGEF